MQPCTCRKTQPIGTMFDTGRVPGGTIVRGRRGVYRIERVLHRGNFSAVYLVTELTTQRFVILKENSYRQWPYDERCRACALLEREGQMLCVVKSYNLPAPRCIERFDYCGRTYLAMTRIPSITLEELHKANPLPEHDLIRRIIELCFLVRDLHAAGIVHNDIKPSNIMVLPDGSLLLVDYGSAEMKRPRTIRSSYGTGTPMFMSPEQASGEVTPSNDIFAIARTVEILIGQPGPAVAAVIERGTARIDLRYKDITEFADDLARTQRQGLIAWLQSLLWRYTVMLVGTLGLSLLLWSIFPVQQPQIVQALRQRATAAPLRPILPTTTLVSALQATPPPLIVTPLPTDVVILDCFNRYQRSRTAAFAKLDVQQIDCVAVGSPLWQHNADLITHLHQRALRRYIAVHRLEVVEVLIDGTMATIMVHKLETRRDVLLTCTTPHQHPGCEAVDSSENEQYRATFLVQQTGTGWQLFDFKLQQ